MPEPDRPLRLALLTEGDPAQRTGGFLYQRHMARAAPAHRAEIEFASVPRRPLPLATAAVPFLLGHLRGHDALLLDSIVAAQAAPWLRAPGTPPVIGLLHQVPGGVDHGRVRQVVQARLDLLAYRHARALIVVSEYLADRVTRLGIDRERITVVAPGRNPAAGQAPEAVGELRQGRQAALLCVANWLPNKGIHFLLEAVAQLPPAAATLHLVGDHDVDPKYTRRLRTRLAASDVNSRVVVHGSLGPASLAGMYAAADVFVLASLHEAYGTACSEAMAAGLPVIAFRTDNLPYLVRDGVDGLLTPPADIAALTAAIVLLCTDPSTRARFASAARQRARAWPTWEQSADRFFDAIRNVTSPSPLAGEGRGGG